MKTVESLIVQLPHAEGLPLPTYATQGSAGMDLCAAITEPLHLMPGERMLLPAGFKMALPAGFEAQIRPRSGLAYRHGVTVLNTPGTIDSDYRDEVKVLLINMGQEPFMIERGMRIAQMVIAPYSAVEWKEMNGELPLSDRVGGFGSTGLYSKHFKNSGRRPSGEPDEHSELCDRGQVPKVNAPDT